MTLFLLQRNSIIIYKDSNSQNSSLSLCSILYNSSFPYGFMMIQPTLRATTLTGYDLNQSLFLFSPICCWQNVSSKYILLEGARATILSLNVSDTLRIYFSSINDIYCGSSSKYLRKLFKSVNSESTFLKDLEALKLILAMQLNIMSTILLFPSLCALWSADSFTLSILF